jgi:hypothetical protein
MPQLNNVIPRAAKITSLLMFCLLSLVVVGLCLYMVISKNGDAWAYIGLMQSTLMLWVPSPAGMFKLKQRPKQKKTEV